MSKNIQLRDISVIPCIRRAFVIKTWFISNIFFFSFILLKSWHVLIKQSSQTIHTPTCEQILLVMTTFGWWLLIILEKNDSEWTVSDQSQFRKRANCGVKQRLYMDVQVAVSYNIRQSVISIYLSIYLSFIHIYLSVYLSMIKLW